MTGRLTSTMIVSALVRRMFTHGEHAMIVAKGDPDAGALLFIIAEKGRIVKMIERGTGPRGMIELVEVGPEDVENKQEIEDYCRRRRSRDPDLWIVELDGANAERFAAETILTH